DVLRPTGEVGLGVTDENMTVDYGPLDVTDIELTMDVKWYLVTVNEPVGSNPCKVYWGDALDSDPDIFIAANFPPVGGDLPIRINCVTATYDYRVFVGVEMEGGYAGVYSTVLDPNNGLVNPWAYLGGPGDPGDTIPTNACTDVYSVYGFSDQLLIATGNSGYIFFYNGTSFTPIRLNGADTIHHFDPLDPYFVLALTGPNGNYYMAPKYYPVYWDTPPSTVPSTDIYDSIVFDNYFFGATGGPAVVYRQTHTDENLVETGELPENPDEVYSLGRLGNLLIAGSGPDGLIYGSRDFGDNWATAVDLGANTDVNSIFIMGGAYSPHVAHAAASGDNGGLHRMKSADTCELISSALDVSGKDSLFGKVYWDVDKNEGEETVKVRTFNVRDFTDAPVWDDIEKCPESGSELIELSSVTRGDKYLQYRIELTPSEDTSESPVFKEIRLEYGNLEFDSLIPKNGVFAFPNPVVGSECEFYFSLADAAEVTVEIYDLKGRLVDTVSGYGDASTHQESVAWDVTGVAPGVYTYRISARTAAGVSDSVVKKVAILK
ncbi:MAG: T9SS type A sorting domain-containing protein, partial [bacterium]|nr:T9SS type A sorting domain-containing protein [bacterium]